MGFLAFRQGAKIHLHDWSWLLEGFWRQTSSVRSFGHRKIFKLKHFYKHGFQKEGKIIILVSFTMMMGGISYFMVILFNMLIYRKLASMRGSMSSKTKEIHRQLSNVLKWQVCSIFYIQRIFNMTILGTGPICNLCYTFDLCLRLMCFGCSDSWEGYNFDSSSDVDPCDESPLGINFRKTV